MMSDLAHIGPGDVVLLHGCCHNPTGANLDAGQWAAVTDHLAKSGALPFVDIAYQGFGDGSRRSPDFTISWPAAEV